MYGDRRYLDGEFEIGPLHRALGVWFFPVMALLLLVDAPATNLSGRNDMQLIFGQS